MTDEERINMDFIENMLENAPVNSIERTIFKNTEQLIFFLDDLIQIEEEPMSLTRAANALDVIGPCDVKLKPEKLEIHTVLDGLYLKFQYATFLNSLKYLPTFALTFCMFSAEIDVEFKIDSSAGKIEYLHEFSIEKFEEVHYEVKGIWPFNKFATYALNFVAGHYKTYVRGWLEAQIRHYMNEKLRALERYFEIPEANPRMVQERISLSDDECSRIEELLRDTEATQVKIVDTCAPWEKNKKGEREVYAQQCILSPTFARKADA
ncbi:uncharacterized protein TNIN_341481 [Trichonephila inaurata madagascariensis]|uniref:Uncharacterized protein n=1 Tax=Trichonephila inaurata madagascariensis TaxID=2747483 RepID=A0A8X6I992_9ARAC|nr:uncharacterized protein TNIN_341481 [Trichonephila inaurata madagascariensis]